MKSQDPGLNSTSRDPSKPDEIKKNEVEASNDDKDQEKASSAVGSAEIETNDKAKASSEVPKASSHKVKTTSNDMQTGEKAQNNQPFS